MIPKITCPECGAILTNTITCSDLFHNMLAWEWEDTRLQEVHHLMVLCYHLQHPSLYSPDGLKYAKELLVDFVEKGLSPQEVRQRAKGLLDSNNRKWKIKASPGSQGAYTHPIQWSMTASDIIAGGMNKYCENVQAWARVVLRDIKEKENL